MNRPDELGILADFRRVSVTTTLLNILWEIIANRKHNPDKSTAKFLFMRFVTTQGRFFILGTNHFRTKDSIEKEHTPFKFNESKADTIASVSARGYGAKLFPFHVRGQYSNLFRLEDSTSFSSELTDWGMKDWVDMGELCRIIDDMSDFDANDFRSRWFTPINKRPGEVPFFLNKDFTGSAVDTFMKENNFKYFYQFLNYNDAINTQLEDTLLKLARIYETSNVEIYYSNNFGEAKQFTCRNGYGIYPKDWIGALTLDWRMGDLDDKSKKYYKSQFRTSVQGNETILWGRNDSNGSVDTKFNHRTASYTPEDGWKPQVRVTIATVNKTYRDSLDEDSKKLQEIVYLRMQDDLISLRDADSFLTPKLRTMKVPSRMRLIIDILEESMKTNPHGGLNVTSLKAGSEIVAKKAIHEMALQSLSIMRKFQLAIEEKDPDYLDPKTFNSAESLAKLKVIIEMDKKNSTRSNKRKKEGLLFEAAVFEKVSELKEININDTDYKIKWEPCSDAIISAKSDIEGQGIDSLGQLKLDDYSIWISIQCKDREACLKESDLSKFKKTVEELKEKKLEINPLDKFITILVLAKEKSFNYKQYYELLKDHIFTIVEPSDDVGSATLETIETVLGLII
jgi:hypothetical protein